MIHSWGQTGSGGNLNLRVGVILMWLAGLQMCIKCVAGSTPAPRSPSVELPSTLATRDTTTALVTTITSYRLPTSLYPLHYNLELQPYINYTDPRNFTFRGSVKILVRCDNATDIIIVHVNGLTVDNTSITLAPETPSASGDPRYSTCREDKAKHFFIARLDKDMEAGRNYWIEMKFTSPLRNNREGLYYGRSQREDHIVYIVSTQFEPISARRAFPCFDEPAMKATFNVTLVRPADRISLSNMPIDHSETPFEEDGTTYVKDVYQQTPKMSTYLLAFVICDYVNLTSKTQNNVTYRTWAKPDSVNATQFALKIAVQMAEFFENYFEIGYPLPKQDIVGVPDFTSSAMENWGLIIFKERLMLYTKGVTNGISQAFMTNTVAHELAHTWAGNIVSPLWWDDVWLNEAFANYFSYAPMKTVLPEWMSSEYFTSEITHAAFGIDDTVDSNPMHRSAEQPRDLEHMLSDIIHKKGAAVVRMLHFVLGDSTFRDGYNNFLKYHQYGSASRDDLYREMTEQATTDCLDINVKEFMDTWVLQRNFPLVTVTRNCHNISSIQVTPARYLQEPSTAGNDTQTSPFGYRWNIPLTFASSSYPAYNPREHEVYWLHKEEQTKLIRVDTFLPNCTDSNGWILANLQQYGFYRVNYNTDNWHALTRQLKRNPIVFSLNNRVQIIDDAWSLARANYIPLDIALETLEYLHDELYYSPWSAAQEAVYSLVPYLELTPLGLPLQEFMRARLSIPFSHFGLVNISEDHRTKLQQAQIANLACYFRVPACLDQAKLLYSSFMQSRGRQQIDPDVKTTVYCAGVAEGSTAEWEFALQMFRTATTKKDAENMLAAMACTRNTEILNRYLNALITDNTTFSADQANIALRKVITTEEGRALAWNFVKTHYQDLQNMDPFTFHCLFILYTLPKHFNRESEITEVYEFRNRYCAIFRLTEFEKQIMEPIKKRVDWYKANSQVIKSWLIRNGVIQN